MVAKGGVASSLPRVLMGFVVFRKRVKTRTLSLSVVRMLALNWFLSPSHLLSLVAEGSHGICSFWKAREDLWRTLSPLPPLRALSVLRMLPENWFDSFPTPLLLWKLTHTEDGRVQLLL